MTWSQHPKPEKAVFLVGFFRVPDHEGQGFIRSLDGVGDDVFGECHEVRDNASVDLVGQGRDSRAFLLAIDVLEAGHRHGSGLDDVPEDGSRSYGWQLIDIADEHDLHTLRTGGQEGAGQPNIHHACFVGQEQPRG